MTEKNKLINGSCLCGAIEYEVELVAGMIFNCHCSKCRKAHGAAFATLAFAKGETLKFLKGEDALAEHKGRRGTRAFCSSCGSRLMNYAPDKNDYLSVTLACVDTDLDVRPVSHVFTGSKASWHEPSDDIPSFEALPRGVA
jgi:hypothetical protein